MEAFDVKRLDALEREELGAWIQDLLERRHTIPVPPETYPAELLAAVFFWLRGETRALAQRILVGFLEDLAYTRASRWHSPAGQELLRVIPLVVFDEQRQRAWSLLLHIAGERDRFAGGSANCHLPALQALLDLRYREPMAEFRIDAEYWRAQRADGPHRAQYLTTILEGMVRAAPAEAMTWLSERDYDDDLASAVQYLLPAFTAVEGFISAFEKARSRLDRRLVEDVLAFRNRVSRKHVAEPRLVERFMEEVEEVRQAFDEGEGMEDWLLLASSEYRIEERLGDEISSRAG